MSFKEETEKVLELYHMDSEILSAGFCSRTRGPQMEWPKRPSFIGSQSSGSAVTQGSVRPAHLSFHCGQSRDEIDGSRRCLWQLLPFWDKGLWAVWLCHASHHTGEFVSVPRESEFNCAIYFAGRHMDKHDRADIWKGLAGGSLLSCCWESGDHLLKKPKRTLEKERPRGETGPTSLLFWLRPQTRESDHLGPFSPWQVNPDQKDWET